MKSLHVNYNKESGKVDTIGDASPEIWEEVCERFDNDVSFVKEVTNQEGYNTLYVCYDDNNQPDYYLVKVDKSLNKLRRKTFYKKLGVDSN